MAKYTYKLTLVPDGWTLEQLEDAMNSAGKNGWLLKIIRTGTGANTKTIVQGTKVLAQ